MGRLSYCSCFEKHIPPPFRALQRHLLTLCYGGLHAASPAHRLLPRFLVVSCPASSTYTYSSRHLRKLFAESFYLWSTFFFVSLFAIQLLASENRTQNILASDYTERSSSYFGAAYSLSSQSALRAHHCCRLSHIVLSTS